ncbi:MAG TPA: hypothetical protein VMF06_12485 [Candidatus Limnocylindria bacterium]|jgi:hypothetical protein|nr:hypothetical protein [Candidatus Limnocylindria bacterium]
MNEIFRFSGGKSDFDNALVWPNGVIRLPTFNCATCGCDNSTIDPWYASVEITASQAASIGGLPERVAGIREFVAIQERVRAVLGIDKKLPPGSILGSKPIEVENDDLIGSLSPENYKRGLNISPSEFQE